MKKVALALSAVALAALVVLGASHVSPGPECVKGHDVTRWDYGYGWGFGYGYDPATNKYDAHYGYGFGYGDHTYFVCDAYVPAPKRDR